MAFQVYALLPFILLFLNSTKTQIIIIAIIIAIAIIIFIVITIISNITVIIYCTICCVSLFTVISPGSDRGSHSRSAFRSMHT